MTPRPRRAISPRRRLLLAGLVLLGGATGPASPAPAAPAPLALDPSFGTGGVVFPDRTIPDYQEAAALAIASDGDTVVVGENNYAPAGAALVRYLPDGSLDPGLGGGTGYVHLPETRAIKALALDQGGDAFVLSQGTTITRIAPDGSPVYSFGDHGSVQVPQPSAPREPLHMDSLAALPDGGVAAAGIRWQSPRMVVVRFLPNGEPDPSFGEGGIVTLGFGRMRGCGAFQVAVQPDGDILLAGYAHGAPALARLLPDGAPDPSFGHRGRAVAPRGVYGEATSLALEPRGGVLASGTGRTSRLGGMLLMRFGPRGRLDRRFGSAGISITRHRRQASTIAVLPSTHRIFVIARGRGPVIRAFRADGRPTESLAQVPGVPRDRFFGTAAALRDGKLTLAWTLPHEPAKGLIELERFSIR